MARKVTVTLEDDLEGGPAQETVQFGLDGAHYEIDLSARNAAVFREQLAPFIDHARRAGRRGNPPPRAGGGQPSAQRRHPGLGEGPRHRCQRARADPDQGPAAVPSRFDTTLTPRSPRARQLARTPLLLASDTRVPVSGSQCTACRVMRTIRQVAQWRRPGRAEKEPAAACPMFWLLAGREGPASQGPHAARPPGGAARRP
jgi:hypothetical protein